MPDAGMHQLHICCIVLRSAEMRNFSAAECKEAIRGNVWNVPHLIFRKLPLDNLMQSAFCKIAVPVPPAIPNHRLLSTAPLTVIIRTNYMHLSQSLVTQRCMIASHLLDCPLSSARNGYPGPEPVPGYLVNTRVAGNTRFINFAVMMND